MVWLLYTNSSVFSLPPNLKESQIVHLANSLFVLDFTKMIAQSKQCGAGCYGDPVAGWTRAVKRR